jgi:predicted RNA-binding protein with PIN domain
MILVVDGYNLYFTGMHPDAQEKHLHRIRTAVIDAVANYCAGRSIKAVVFFDGGPGGKYMPRVQREKGVEIRFSEPVGDADQDIMRAVSKSHNPSEVRVVTSDRKIRQFVEREGATVVSAQDFAAELCKIPEDEEAPPPDEPRVKYSAPSRSEVEYWLRIFSQKKENGDKPT